VLTGASLDGGQRPRAMVSSPSLSSPALGLATWCSAQGARVPGGDRRTAALGAHRDMVGLEGSCMLSGASSTAACATVGLARALAVEPRLSAW